MFHRLIIYSLININLLLVQMLNYNQGHNNNIFIKILDFIFLSNKQVPKAHYVSLLNFWFPNVF